jgi:hypothetical protein
VEVADSPARAAKQWRPPDRSATRTRRPWDRRQAAEQRVIVLELVARRRRDLRLHTPQLAACVTDRRFGGSDSNVLVENLDRRAAGDRSTTRSIVTARSWRAPRRQVELPAASQPNRPRTIRRPFPHLTAAPELPPPPSGPMRRSSE